MHRDHLEFEEALPLLSVPAEQQDPGGLPRRRFLQLALAGAAGTMLPALRPRSAGAAEAAGPSRPDEGVLVVVFLGGGNDGLNTIAPISGSARGAYESLRGELAVPAGSLLPLDGEWGLHPKLDGLHRRFHKGTVALVEGTGMPAADLSHFTATAKVMQGKISSASGTGWLGRYLDGLPDGDGGLRGLAVASSVPMYLVGERANVTSVPSDGKMWGADRTPPGEATLLDAVAAFGSAPTGLGPWGDRLAATNRAAVHQAQALVPAFADDAGPVGLARDLLLAARLINLDLGARVIGVTVGGWDTHAVQGATHEANLADLDDAIEVFFANLQGHHRRRVAMLVQSEFGRRPAGNASLGTDHGTAGPMLVIGDQVRGGRHVAPPRLDRLDDRGNLVPSIDFRAVYQSLLDEWLGGDGRRVLDGSYPGLQLFARGPGR